MRVDAREQLTSDCGVTALSDLTTAGALRYVTWLGRVGGVGSMLALGAGDTMSRAVGARTLVGDDDAAAAGGSSMRVDARTTSSPVQTSPGHCRVDVLFLGVAREHPVGRPSGHNKKK